MEDEEIECENCSIKIPAANVSTHLSYCLRYNKKCDQCVQIVDIRSIQDHITSKHPKKTRCNNCHQPIEPRNSDRHLLVCPMRMEYCVYCDSEYPNMDFEAHRKGCSKLTKECTNCKCLIAMKHYITHLKTCVRQNMLLRENSQPVLNKFVTELSIKGELERRAELRRRFYVENDFLHFQGLHEYISGSNKNILPEPRRRNGPLQQQRQEEERQKSDTSIDKCTQNINNKKKALFKAESPLLLLGPSERCITVANKDASKKDYTGITQTRLPSPNFRQQKTLQAQQDKLSPVPVCMKSSSNPGVHSLLKDIVPVSTSN